MDARWTLDRFEPLVLTVRGWCIGLIGLIAAIVACEPVTPEQPPSEPARHAAPPVVAPGAPRASTSAQPGSPPAPPGKRNVLLISIDAFRADHAPWLGYGVPNAPRLTKLARSAVSYSRAYSISSYTAMSFAGFLSGRYPSELQRSGSFFSAHPDSETFFPELLQEKGIRTLAAHAHFYFDKKAGFRQGFDVYEMVPGISADNKTDKNITSPEHTQLAIDLLSKPENTAGQFFAWFHFMDPHDRYMKHEGYPFFGNGGTQDRYDVEIAFTDAHIGKLLDFVASQPWAERTTIIVTADHGEAFGEHKMTRHGFELWEVLIHVPLMISVPGATPRAIDTPRSHVDLAPTIFELLGVTVPPTFQGESLLPEITGDAPAEARDVVIDLPRTGDNDRRRALVHGNHKIISFGDDFRYELYDVVADPDETVDLRKRDHSLHDAMKKRYLERVKTIKDICPAKRDRLRNKLPERDC